MRDMRAFEVKAGAVISLPMILNDGTSIATEVHVRKVGHDFRNRLIEILAWDGRREILSPYAEVKQIEAWRQPPIT